MTVSHLNPFPLGSFEFWLEGANGKRRMEIRIQGLFKVEGLRGDSLPLLTLSWDHSGYTPKASLLLSQPDYPLKSTSSCAPLCSDSHVFAIPQNIACHAHLSMGFSQQKYWGGLSFPSPLNLSNPGTELASPALAGGFFSTVPPGKPYIIYETPKGQDMNLTRFQKD